MNPFHEKDLLGDDDLTRLLKNGKNILTTKLKSGSYKIHKKCYNQFNGSNLKRSFGAKKRKKSINSINTRSQCPTNVHFVE